MAYEVRLHTAVAILDSLSSADRERCVATLFRLRVGDFRFEYFAEDGIVWVVKAFRRGEGY